MNISKIKESLILKKGERLQFSFHGSRNQVDKFNGIIINIYPYVFTVCDVDSNNRIKSFTYVDILLRNLLILDVNN